MSEHFSETTDYYELLECEPDASPEELKKAYRRAALKWHPDRNHGREEEATRVFQLIEHAYSILTDDHERAWYDGHRNMARDETGEFTATSVDIMSLFHACAYMGFGETKAGFYPVFRKAFATLAEEEHSKTPIPGFGYADTPWEEVNNFYSFWTCFTTKRSFSFNDIYHLRDAPNAMYRRYMSKENEKLRKKAEKEFVLSVRELANYVKKRDPRVKKHLAEVEEEKQRRQAAEEQKRIAQKQKIQEELDKLDNEPKIEYTEEDLIYLHQFDKKEDSDDSPWSCRLCNKTLTKEAAFRAHCRTKKHLKTALPEKRKFLNDPTCMEHCVYNYILLGLTNQEIFKATGENINIETAEILLDDDDVKQNNKNEEEENNEEENEEEEEIQKQKRPLSKKEKRRLKNKAMRNEEEKEEKMNKNQKNPPNMANMSKKEKRKMQIKMAKEKKLQQEQEELEAKRQMKQMKNMMRQQKQENENQTQNEEEETNEQTQKQQQQQQQLSKKEKRKLKLKQQQKLLEEEMNNAAADGNDKNAKVFLPKGMKNPPPGKFMCRKCRQLFDSRTKLFAHLEATNHATAR
ncbi:dnaJ subfamily C member 21 [Histomonas meleagridis]|uniref:dnaJ-like subfamily C member 21 n=1 Tax=Histomonas meleagridis TaxID=135588 RepID=UPI00355A98DC|nr:dnaJ subfamily C member 21 [Histomonas meleagridis]KAH0796394.1 dnaJ-like subfamily C member 21 [Histomonas meleagridis]